MQIFNEDFVWGAATASYQIEGATQEDGRSPSVWDMFCRKNGAVYHGHNGDIACDHYHRYPEDVALMKELGIGAYRFSIAWPRILPNGTGAPNPKGIAFYDRLVDALLEAGIQPWATLYHWDLPLCLYHKGGWLNPEIPNWFADYTAVVVDALSDRVSNWMTLNEPQVFIGLGLQSGDHAPGDRLRWNEVLLAIHHTHLAHGRAVQTIRARSKQPARIGVVPAVSPGIPVSQDPKDIEVARQGTFAIHNRSAWQQSWWLDPIFFGKYPQDGLDLFGDEMPPYTSAEMETISQPIDFIGLNIYRGFYAKADADGKPVPVPAQPGEPMNAVKWPITPECLYWGPRLFHERYKKPIVITENGLAGLDSVSLDGKVHDPQRIDYTHRHLQQLQRAAQDGVPIEGYFHWSFLDNFEWGEGYKERFGLVYVDYQTQERIQKDSFRWYRETIAKGGVA